MFKVFKVHTFQAIVINYIVCVITGALFAGPEKVLNTVDIKTAWFWIGVGLGLVFIVTFYLMALTTQKYSITVSSIAAKMSLVIPVVVSFFVLGTVSKSYSLLNYFGMFLALPAILLGSIKKNSSNEGNTTYSGLKLLLPLAVFLASGLIDSTINITNFKFLSDKEEAIFPIVIFGAAALAGILVMTIRRTRITIRNLIGGTVLGVVNYFSIYFLILSLSSYNNDGAFVYPLINVGIILASAMVSATLFKEKLSIINLTGIALAIICIVLISYQELFFNT